MAHTRSLQELVTALKQYTETIDDFLAKNSRPQPSLQLGADLTLSLPPELDATRQEALSTCNELQLHLQGPLPYLVGLVNRQGNFMFLQAICRFKIAENLGLEQTVTFEELARRCDLDVESLRRFVTTAIANRVFQYCFPGRVKHNALSAAIARSAELRAYLLFTCEELLPSSSRVVDALQQHPGSEEPTCAGFSLANGGEVAFFDAIGADQERLERYSATMGMMHKSSALNIAHLVDNLNWEGNLVPDMIVDVGGNRGAVCVEILRKFNGTRGVVADMGEVIRDAEVPADLAGRLTFVAQDLFAVHSIRDADVYFLRWILHDWPDAHAIRILQNLTPALKPGARLLLNEIVMPEPAEIPLLQEQYLRAFDLNMKSLHNGKERSIEQWTELLRAADLRLELKSVKRIPQSLLAIIEVAWNG